MHELSLCSQLHRIVERAAAGRPVSVVHLQVGQLRQVVPETLRFCWSLIAGSELAVESVPVTVACRRCGEVSTIADVFVLLCARCHSAEVELRTGEELLVTSLDLVPARDTEV